MCGLLLVLLVLLVVVPLSASSKHGVYYQIFVRSFADGNGDGIGDLQGIISRLDYLVNLGIAGIWLTPIHPSPTYHKYDVIDYYAIDPEIGTMADFQELLAQAHARGIKVIMDLVVNHTSSQHPWFLSAKQGPESEYRDYYIWATPDTDVQRRGPWQQQVWYPAGNSRYYALFWSEMPDLNFNNPKVREEVKQIAGFWLEQGVDGFRIDAAKHLFEHDPTQRPWEWWQEFSDYVTSLKPDVYLVGEVWDSTHVVAPYFSAFDSNFNFELAGSILPIVRFGLDTGLVEKVIDQHTKYQKAVPGRLPIDAPFLSNHDQDRVMSVLGGDWRKAKMAAALLLTLPGNPFIYAGEEIGMQGRGDHEHIREPFKWYDLEGPSQTSWRPNLFNTGKWQPSVESQAEDPDSLLNHYRSLIHTRNSEPTLRYGSLIPVDVTNPRTIVFGREWQGKKAFVLHNISGSEQTALIDGVDLGALEVIFANAPYTADTEGGNLVITLAPYSTLIFK